MPLETLLTLKGWRRCGLAALLGICAAVALPPFYGLPLLVPAFAGLFLLVCHAANGRQAFSDGWWWGLGHFTVGLYWICISLWVEPEKFAWLTPVALFGLPAIVALYIALVTLLLHYAYHRWHVKQALKLVLCFAALWVGAEYLRAHLFTGFPWNLIGYVWTVSDVTVQFASVVGIYGLSWVTVIVASMPALFWYPGQAQTAIFPNFSAAGLLLGMVIFGVWHLDTHPTQMTDVKVRIVQANIQQSLKWDERMALQGLKKHTHLTASEGIDSIKLVLWPETAVPYYIKGKSPITEDLGSFIPRGSLLITGGLRSDTYNNSVAWNSVFAIDKDGNVVAEYDKHHLVPFGEYIPLRGVPGVDWLIERIAKGMGDFSRGPGPQTLDISPYPRVSPLVCYEAIFPDEATDGMHRAQWLFSLTDDAWFGISSGPFQDLEMARMRAVEQGLPLLRAANTGISAAFDAYGRTLAQLPLEKEGVLDLYLPKAEAQEPIASRYPKSWVLFLIAGNMILLFLHRKKY